MIKILCVFLLPATMLCNAQMKDSATMDIKLESRIKGKYLHLTYQAPKGKRLHKAILLIHGASFPSALATGFRMNGLSWMDDLSNAGYDVYALDFLGYGKSDRYHYMSDTMNVKESLGLGSEVVTDIDIAVDHIRSQSKGSKVHLIGHSWGATVSGHYATLFPEKIDKLVLFAPIIQRSGPASWEKSEALFEDKTPSQRVGEFASAVPEGQEVPLEKDVLEHWEEQWLASDPTSATRTPASVRYPMAWEMDLYNCWNGNCFFEPSGIKSPTLLIRGEWDTAFSFEDAQKLFGQLENVPLKKLVVIDKSTHVMHLEKRRLELYKEVRLFLQ